jgi:hypothetical protein
MTVKQNVPSLFEEVLTEYQHKVVGLRLWNQHFLDHIGSAYYTAVLFLTAATAL